VNKTLLVLQHIDREGPGLIAVLGEERGMNIKIVRVDQGEKLPDPNECNNTIALVLGGPMGANERTEPNMSWLQRELDWITIWRQQSKPMIGICLGAQLLAIAEGGYVKPLEVGEPPVSVKEVGFGALHWLKSSKTANWLHGFNDSDVVLHWHGDQIKLPGSATLLGSTLLCPEQIFHINDHAVGLQCHLEADEQSLNSWIKEDIEFITTAMGKDGAKRLHEDAKRFNVSIEKLGRRFFEQVLDQLIENTFTRC
jgi:GMP synthase-like glutamine amidotransferase